MKPFKLVLYIIVISGFLIHSSGVTAAAQSQNNPAARLASLQEPARVLHVPDDYATITEALQASLSGDTVQVDAGTYPERFNIPAGVSLVGAGWENTFIVGSNAGIVILAGPDSLIEGFTIRGSGPNYYDAGIEVIQGQVTVRGVRLNGNGAGLWALCFDPATCNIHVTVEHSIVDESLFTGINSNEFPVLTLRNNTIVRNQGPAVALNNQASLAEYNIIASNKNDGLVNNVGASTQYNIAWGNAKDFVGARKEDNISTDPLFRDLENGNYRLRAGSPAVGTGADSGIDLGALAFEPVGLPPGELNLSVAACSAGQVTWSETGASGYILYYGPSSRETTTFMDLSTATSFTLADVSEASAGYLAVSQYDSEGQESAVKVYSAQPKPCPTAPKNLQVGAFPGGKIQLQWSDPSQVEEGYQIERSTGAEAASDYTVVASLPAGSTVYTDTLPTLGETYWYRVQAYNASGASTYSNPGFSVPFDDVPNEDERYMLVLINEARAAPDAYGLSAFRPTPPLSYNPQMSYAARAQSQAIVNSGFSFGQIDPAGRTPTDRARAVGYDQEVTEILIEGTDGPNSVEGSQNSFLVNENSRQKMLCSCYNQAGLGYASNPAKDNGDPSYGQYSVDFSSLPGMTPQNLPSGIAVPYTGIVNKPVTYIVNYYNEQGYAPEQALVYIDGVPYEMSLSSGSESNGTYRFATNLPFGEHDYYFSFTFPTGQARLPETGAYAGPQVEGIFIPLVYSDN